MKKALILLAFLVLTAGVIIGILALREKDEIVCDAHKDFNGDLLCDVCNNEIESNNVCEIHTDKNHDGKCDSESCEKVLEIIHTDGDGNKVCDSAECGAHLESTENGSVQNPDVNNGNSSGSDSNGNEDNENITNPPCQSCVDANSDFNCDLCGKLLQKTDDACTECYDSNFNGLCDKCGKELKIESDNGEEKEPCSTCADLDHNGICDICGRVLEAKEPCEVCSDSNGDGICDLCEKEVPKDYEINSFTISGLSIQSHVIAYDSSNAENAELAYEICSFIREKSGIILSVISIDMLTSENYISVSSREKSGEEGFYVKITEDKNLEITTEFPNQTLKAGRKYLSSVQADADKIAELSEAVINVRDVFYEDFGAVGDGITDDYEAILAAHSYANEHGHTVVARENAKYYMAAIQSTVKISTNVCWQNASFIIDDRETKAGSRESKLAVFTVIPDYEAAFFDRDSSLVQALNGSGGIRACAENIGIAFGYPVILTLENRDSNLKEIILIDADGNIDPSTPILNDFEKLTSVYSVRTDDSPITVKGGNFVLLPNRSESSTPFARNIEILRSNTTLSDIGYEIQGVTETPLNYLAFISIRNSCNVLITKYNFKAHASYPEDLGHNAISTQGSVKITLKTCVQTNFYELDGTTPSIKHRGVLIVSHTKDVSLITSFISIFDLEKGAYNATVKNSTLFDLIAEDGSAVSLENTFVYSN